MIPLETSVGLKSETFARRYLADYTTLQERILARERQKMALHQTKDWVFVSTNLTNFMPELPMSDHERIYLQVVVNHAARAHDRQLVDDRAVDYLQPEGNLTFLEPAEKRKPKIFCTYHLGSYQSIVGILAREGIDMAMVVDTNTVQKQSEETIKTVSRINELNNVSSRMRILDAERPDIGICMAQALRQGYSIVIYIDGNSGTGGIYKRGPKTLMVPFLNQELCSRTGIALTSFALKVPIIPMVSYYEWINGSRTPRFLFFDPIAPASGVVQTDYVADTTRSLYALLETYLRRYVDQWESWLYVHKFLDFDSLSKGQQSAYASDVANDDRVYFQENRYGLFKMDVTSYLMDKRTYRIVAIHADLFSILQDLRQPQLLSDVTNRLTSTTLAQLVERGILAKV
ncbi:lysophospholipid acyltransferase family protein [Spirosoma validum]|uniref:Lysophospholipid acyltransferase family protein n=1 Tax=Spirosoma validum TaxID=2771355 RepID=A0A927B287_9BACT|nr:hypothetical protein [Spirosoma validum]MBD2754063.1 hypothetical protein [Spirosoma validum]